MGTTVTENGSDPSKVDVVVDDRVGGVGTMDYSTETKVAYLARLNTEKNRIASETTNMEASIVNCDARSTEIDTIITAVNNL